MTTTATRPTTTRETDRRERRAALVRGLHLEFARHRCYLLMSVALCLLLVAGSLVWTFQLGFLVILWTLHLPAKLASPVKDVAWRGDRDQLWRATQGVSRADTVRARTLLIGIAQTFAVLVVTALVLINNVGVTSLVLVPGSERLVEISAAWLLAVGPLTFTAAIVWSHAVVGGQALRSGRAYVLASSLCTYVAVYLALGLGSLFAAIGVSFLAGDGVDSFMPEPELFLESDAGQWSLLTAILVPLLALLAGIYALVRRSRRWARGA